MKSLFRNDLTGLLLFTVGIRNICKFLSYSMLCRNLDQFKIHFSFDLSQPNFFTSAVRSRIVQFILDRKKFSREPKNDFAFGIQRLITEGAYISAYPLHDVSLN